MAIDTLVFLILIFGLTSLLPWLDGKSGEKLPLGTVYVNDLEGWVVFKIAHISICVLLAVIGALTIRRIRKLRTSR